MWKAVATTVNESRNFAGHHLGAHMTFNELITAVRGGLKPLGIYIGRTGLYAYAHRELIAPPERGRRSGDWSTWAAAEAVAAAFLIRRCNWSQAAVKFCRLALAHNLESDRTVVRDFLGHRHPQEESLIFQWLLTVLKVRLGKPLDGGLSVRAVEDPNSRLVTYRVSLPPDKYPHGPKLSGPNVKFLGGAKTRVTWVGETDLLIAGGWNFAGPAPTLMTRE